MYKEQINHICVRCEVIPKYCSNGNNAHKINGVCIIGNEYEITLKAFELMKV